MIEFFDFRLVFWEGLEEDRLIHLLFSLSLCLLALIGNQKSEHLTKWQK